MDRKNVGLRLMDGAGYKNFGRLGNWHLLLVMQIIVILAKS